MLKPIVQAPNRPILFLSSSSCLQASDIGTLSLRRPTPASSRSSSRRASRRAPAAATTRCSHEAQVAQQTALTATKSPTSVKAVVTVKSTIGGNLSHIGIKRGLDDIQDLLGKTLLLELVASELDSRTGGEKTVEAFAHRAGHEGEEARYEANFKVPKGFGEIGAVLVTNEHHKEMFLIDIVLTTGDDDGTPLTFDCRSWVHSKFDNPDKRIFFTTKSYLPSDTPSGLESLRKIELANLCGDGTGERKSFERIYDYDVYNDLGDPSVEDKARPVLGGTKQLPYPRRCRTGRPKTKEDYLSEERSSSVYIPRDEAFSEVKGLTFSVKTLRSVLHAVVPSIETALVNTDQCFPHFTAIDLLYNEGVPLPKQEGFDSFRSIIPRLVKALEGAENMLLFETPEMIDRDRFSWLTDEEFSRQTLAGSNPFSIQLVTEFPFVSKLDPEIYGPPESFITEELLEQELKGTITVKEALEQKKLFMLDYHDLFLPFVHKVRELDESTLYGSRTVFFLTPNGTLKPLAIELTRPASPTKPQWKRVFTTPTDSTAAWLWKLAKAHVACQDTGYHQLVSHWLRTHCCTEPYVIAMNRQLSAMHPIYRLMHPHFRYTMEINALAREYLINAGGIIETCFFSGKYSIELSSVAYRDLWRFDMEALPADLIRRGLAVEDPTAENGVKLTIEDYPYANDGLLVWSSIKQWVSDYVYRYYPDPAQVREDPELQAWWADVRTRGHADKKDEPWWPVLGDQEDLVGVLTTIFWVSSGHHAAVNFGQYLYAGYFPNRPTTIRSNMPVEEDESLPPSSEAFRKFWTKPEAVLLESFPTPIQATVVMAILDVLSSHAPDEEYLGDRPEPAYAADAVVNAAFERFGGRMKEIEGIIDARNVDMRLKNRCGAGIVPYELLKPFSEPGVTGKGVPNSISI